MKFGRIVLQITTVQENRRLFENTIFMHRSFK